MKKRVKRLTVLYLLFILLVTGGVQVKASEEQEELMKASADKSAVIEVDLTYNDNGVIHKYKDRYEEGYTFPDTFFGLAANEQRGLWASTDKLYMGEIPELEGLHFGGTGQSEVLLIFRDENGEDIRYGESLYSWSGHSTVNGNVDDVFEIPVYPDGTYNEYWEVSTNAGIAINKDEESGRTYRSYNLREDAEGYILFETEAGRPSDFVLKPGEEDFVYTTDGTYQKYPFEVTKRESPGMQEDGETPAPEAILEGNVTIDGEKQEIYRTTGHVGSLIFTLAGEHIVSPIEVPEDFGPLNVRKELSGRELKAGEFTFQLIDIDTGEVVYEGTNDTEGNVTFPIDFQAPTGEYEDYKRYYLIEKDDNKGGISYDGQLYGVIACVGRNSDGTPAVGWQIFKLNIEEQSDILVNEAVFCNTYTAKPAEITIEGTKVLKGRNLKEGEFTFQLLKEDGTVIEEVQNREDGAVVFSPLTYTEAGVYKYTVKEKKGEDADIIYDEKVYPVTVTVTDNKQGYLYAVANGDGKKLVITNKVKSFVGDVDNLDRRNTAIKTGDETEVIRQIIIGLLAFTVLGVSCLVIRKRKI